MSGMYSETAVILFTRRASEEAQVKDLAGNTTANQQIAQKLIKHAEGVLKKTGLPWFIIDSDHQHGNNFGERFTDSFEQIFNLGYKNVIAIGNDCPLLTENDIRNAAAQFRHAGYVLGPATDGGFYLIGLSKENYNREFLIHAPWNTKELHQYFIQYLETISIDFALQDVKSDIDSVKDIHNLVYRHKKLFWFRQFIESLKASLIKNWMDLVLIPVNRFTVYISGLRAPPAVIFA